MTTALDIHDTLFGADPISTHKAEQQHGPCFQGGRLRWLSASILTMGDPASPAGCLRRLHYAKVLGKREPTSAAMAIGTAGHARIERYLRTGEKVLDSVELAGWEFIPEPDPANLIEASIAEWGLAADGVPVVGHIDLLRQGRGYVRDNGDKGWDPENTVEVLDWKFRGNLINAVNGPALANTVQMITYGEAAARRFGVEYVRLSHVNFQTKSKRAARKATVLVRREDLSKRWNKVEGLARTIQRAVTCTTPEDVEPNTNACGAYGGCPHRQYCTAGQRATVDEFFGATRAAALNGDDMTANLLSLLNLPATPAPAAAPDVNPPRITFPEERAAAPLLPQVSVALPIVPAGPTAEEIAAERARLEEESQAALRAAAAAERSRAEVAGIREVWGAIASAGRGLPALSGDAYRVYSVAVSDVVPPAGAIRMGEGQLGAITLTDPRQFAQLAAELGVTVPAAVLAPDAPPSDPAQAAVPVEGFSDPAAVAAYAEKAKRGRPKKAKPAEAAADKGCSMPYESRPAVVVAPVTPPAAAPAPLAPAPGPVEAAPPAAGPSMPQPEAPGTVAGLVLYVDAMSNGPTASLDGYIDQLCAMLCKEYGIADIRLGPKDGPLGFGRWKGAVAAVARRYPPPAGAYTLRTASEVAGEVAEALRPLCAPGCWIVGVSR